MTMKNIDPNFLPIAGVSRREGCYCIAGFMCTYCVLLLVLSFLSKPKRKLSLIDRNEVDKLVVVSQTEMEKRRKEI